MHRENTEDILNHRKNMHLKLVIQGIVIGLISGLVIVLNRILIYKFFGVLLALSVGLSVRREGPSVQMDASIGEGLANRFVKKLHAEEFIFFKTYTINLLKFLYNLKLCLLL